MSNSYSTIKDFPLEERPREKLLNLGADNLSTAELLALILRTGVKNKTVLTLAQELLATCDGLRGIINYSSEQLQKLEGIGEAKAANIKAVIELSKRFAQADLNLNQISSPEEVVGILAPELRDELQEKFIVVLLTTKYEIISWQEISKGSLNKSVINPREVFRPAIKRNSAAIVVAHNHPSGKPEASEADIQLTRRLKKAGNVIGIDVLDHLIIGANDYQSLKRQGYF